MTRRNTIVCNIFGILKKNWCQSPFLGRSSGNPSFHNPVFRGCRKATVLYLLLLQAVASPRGHPIVTTGLGVFKKVKKKNKFLVFARRQTLVLDLPDFGKRHLYVQILEPGLVATFHSGKVLEKAFLDKITRRIGKLRIHLHRFEFFLDGKDKTIYGF